MRERRRWPFLQKVHHGLIVVALMLDELGLVLRRVGPLPGRRHRALWVAGPVTAAPAVTALGLLLPVLDAPEGPAAHAASATRRPAAAAAATAAAKAQARKAPAAATARASGRPVMSALPALRDLMPGLLHGHVGLRELFGRGLEGLEHVGILLVFLRLQVLHLGHGLRQAGLERLFHGAIACGRLVLLTVRLHGRLRFRRTQGRG